MTNDMITPGWAHKKREEVKLFRMNLQLFADPELEPTNSISLLYFYYSTIRSSGH